MPRTLLVPLFCVYVISGPALAGDWVLGQEVLLDEYGTKPAVWSGTVAYLVGSSNASVWYSQDGVTSSHLYGPLQASWEPDNSNGVVAWRNTTSGANSSEILVWNGQSAVNISNSPTSIDSDLSVGSNGDVIWSQGHYWLMYYTAETETTENLIIRGIHPDLYITADGVATYAWQDPSTNKVYYFDGTETHHVGTGLADSASPSLWNGAVAWIGEGVGDLIGAGELFFWKNGVTTRVTDDDAVNGISDDDPSLWNDVVMWSRNGPWAPRLYLWDGADTIEMASNARYPSYHHGKVAWVSTTGLRFADVRPIVPGDCDASGYIDKADFEGLYNCLTGPDSVPLHGCDCYDINGDSSVDLLDFSFLQQEFHDVS